MRYLSLFVFLVVTAPTFAQNAPVDRRFNKPIDYNGYFPWTPPRDLKAWDKRREVVREQLLVSQGLWPMPPKTPLEPVIHGEIERDGYVIKKVFFSSLPGQ